MITKAIRSVQRRRSDEGASAVEYGLLVALIAAVVVLAVYAIGQLVHKGFQDTCSGIQTGVTTSSADCTK